MYKFDTHVHTSETSPCGSVSAEDTVKLYIKAGYSGVCITDHYNRRYFDAWKCDTWSDTISRFFQGYRKAKEYGDKNNFDVLLGAELMFDNSLNEYLLFGITEEFLYQYPRLYEYKIEDFRKLTTKNNIMIFQAHPFRPNLTRENPLYLDGVEIANGNFRHNSHNDLALNFAHQNGLLISGGSDCHEIEDVGKSGIMTDLKIENLDTLINILNTKNLEVIQP